MVTAPSDAPVGVRLRRSGEGRLDGVSRGPSAARVSHPSRARWPRTGRSRAGVRACHGGFIEWWADRRLPLELGDAPSRPGSPATQRPTTRGIAPPISRRRACMIHRYVRAPIGTGCMQSPAGTSSGRCGKPAAHSVICSRKRALAYGCEHRPPLITSSREPDRVLVWLSAAPSSRFPSDRCPASASSPATAPGTRGVARRGLSARRGIGACGHA